MTMPKQVVVNGLEPKLIIVQGRSVPVKDVPMLGECVIETITIMVRDYSPLAPSDSIKGIDIEISIPVEDYKADPIRCEIRCEKSLQKVLSALVTQAYHNRGL